MNYTTFAFKPSNSATTKPNNSTTVKPNNSTTVKPNNSTKVNPGNCVIVSVVTRKQVIPVMRIDEDNILYHSNNWSY